MEVPLAMFPRDIPGLTGKIGGTRIRVGSDGGDGGVGGGGLSRTRSNHEQGCSGAFLQDSKPPYRKPPSPGRKHPPPGEPSGPDIVNSGTHTTAEVLNEGDPDSHLSHIRWDADYRGMPSPPHPGFEAMVFDSGTAGITNDHDGIQGDLSAGERGNAAEAGHDSFLGFDFGARSGEAWDQEDGSRSEDEVGRDRSASRQEASENLDFGGLSSRSSDGVDAEGTMTMSCDLGWGESVMFDDPSEADGRSWRAERDGEEAGMDGAGERNKQGARSQSVPEFDRIWMRGGHELTRPSRARSSSFYEDDDNVMACIDGETPVRRRSCSSSGTASDPIDMSSYGCGGAGRLSRLNRPGSLAYSSSGEISASELDAWSRPRDSRSGLTASQAASVMSSGVPRPGKGGGEERSGRTGEANVGGEEVEGREKPLPSGRRFLTSPLGGRDRLLRPNEEKALLEVGEGLLGRDVFVSPSLGVR